MLLAASLLGLHLEQVTQEQILAHPVGSNLVCLGRFLRNQDLGFSSNSAFGNNPRLASYLRDQCWEWESSVTPMDEQEACSLNRAG